MRRLLLSIGPLAASLAYGAQGVYRAGVVVGGFQSTTRCAVAHEVLAQRNTARFSQTGKRRWDELTDIV
jgi:hypothetical protein